MAAGRNRPSPPDGGTGWLTWAIVIYGRAGIATAAGYTRKGETEDTVTEGIAFGANWPLHWSPEFVEAPVEQAPPLRRRRLQQRLDRQA